MRRRTEVIVRKHSPDRAIVTGFQTCRRGTKALERISKPALDVGLRSDPLLWAIRSAADLARRRLCGQVCSSGCSSARRDGAEAVCYAPALIHRVDPGADGVRTQGAVFIVETVCRSVRRGHIEFHEVNVLSNYVCRRAHLKIVDKIVIRHKVGLPILDYVTGVGPEKERLRRTLILVCRDNVLP